MFERPSSHGQRLLRAVRTRWALVLLALAAATRLGAPVGFVVDHRHVDLFDRIPETYLAAARDRPMLFSNRSVGVNINDALNFLVAPSWGQTSANARRDYYDDRWHWKTFTQADRNAGLVPARILFAPDPVKYNRTNWTFEVRSGTWSELTGDFINSLAPQYLATKAVLSYQFSYLNVMDTDDIAHPSTGFFSRHPKRYDIHDLEDFMAPHTNRVFFFWTTSLARSLGSRVATEFNQQMRQYCRTHNVILLDFADIISHTPEGRPCYDNRDGVPYVSQTGQSEDYPDDGMNYPACCQDYTTEVDGGHLGSVSGGGIRAAKSLWVLMARIAGWKPSALPDDWLWRNDLNWDGSDDHADPDHDGMDNWAEYLAGTVPTNAASRLNVRATLQGGGLNTVVLSWSSVTGRLYRVEFQTNLALSGWLPLATNLAAVPPQNQYTNTPPPGSSGFYRIGLEPFVGP